MFVGKLAPGADENGEPLALIEADLAHDVAAVPLSKYQGFNTRVYRAVSLTDEDANHVPQFLYDRISLEYDQKNVIDLARYLIPTPPFPVGFRRGLLAFSSSDPTRVICSTLIAQAFQSDHSPILPDVKRIPDFDLRKAKHTIREVLHVRHHSLFAPRDFDLSPFFDIVKPTIDNGLDYEQLHRDETVRGFDSPNPR